MVPAIPENANQAEQMIFNLKAEHQDILGCVLLLFFFTFKQGEGRVWCATSMLPVAHAPVGKLQTNRGGSASLQTLVTAHDILKTVAC